MEGIRRVFGGNPDSFKLVLEYGRESAANEQTAALPGGQVRLPVALATMEFEFNSHESESAVLERFTQAKSRIAFDRLEERVVVKLAVEDDGPYSRCKATVSLACISPVLRCLQVVRTSSAGNVSEALLTALLKHCELGGVWKLRGAEGFGNFWCSCCEVRCWRSLANLNLSGCGLSSLPPGVGQLASLRILRLSHNRLAALPPELSGLGALEVLAADHNLLTGLPAELRRCSSLRHLELEGNRLATPVLDLRALSRLVSLQLYGNPLEFLPELSPAAALRSLSLANVRIMADAGYTRWEVEVAALPYISRGHKLAPLFKLTFRRSSCQHPLLAGALGRLSEDRSHCELMSRDETAVQQLVLMALSEQPVVAEQACRTLGALAQLGLATARRLLAHDVVSTILTLLRSPRTPSKLCGMQLLANLAAASEPVSAELLSLELLQLLQGCVQAADPDPRVAALTALANLAFARENKMKIRAASGLLGTLVELAMTAQRGAGGGAGATATGATGADALPGSPPSSGVSAGVSAAAISGADAAARSLTPTSAASAAASTSPDRAPQHLHSHQQQQQQRSKSSGSGQARSGQQRHSDTGGPGPGPGAGAGPNSSSGLGSSPPPGCSRSPSSALGATSHATASSGPSGAPAASSSCGGTSGGSSDPRSPPTPQGARALHHSASTPAAMGGGGGGGTAAADSSNCTYNSSSNSTGGSGSVGGGGVTASSGFTVPSGFAALAAAASRALSPARVPPPSSVTASSAASTATAATAATTEGGGPVATASGTASAAAGAPASGAPATSPSPAGLMSPTSQTTTPADALATGGGGGGKDAAAAATATTTTAATAAAAAAASAAGLPPQIAQAPPRAVPEPVEVRDQSRLLAIKVLAILGENEQVRRALGQAPVSGRGVRVLALDGGGMRGLALVQIMRHIERRAGRPLHELFDLVVGTSTGAIVAFGLGVFHFSLEQCESIYTGLGHKVFNQAAKGGSVSGTPRTPREELMAAAQAQAAAQAAAAQAAAAVANSSSSSGGGAGGTGSSSGGGTSSSSSGWFDGMFNILRGTSTNLRVAVYGFKHDASTFEELLRQMCDVKKLGCVGNQLIDAAALGGPKVAAVATLVSVCPVTPFLFTSYELPPEVAPAAAAMHACPSSSKHLIWQAVRASSAAPYYLDDFVCGEERYQDGAATANNPSILALQQARLLWPDTPLAALVSLGCGTAPSVRRERGAHAVLDTGAVLVDAATSPDRADEALSTLLPLVPGVRYFRFQPVHERCAMELDDVDPQHWAALQAAVDEYCTAHSARFDELAELLTAGDREQQQREREGAAAGEEDGEDAAAAAAKAEEEEAFEAPAGVGPDGSPLPLVPRVRLGSRRGVVLVEAPRFPPCTSHPAPPSAAFLPSASSLPSGGSFSATGPVGLPPWNPAHPHLHSYSPQPHPQPQPHSGQPHLSSSSAGPGALEAAVAAALSRLTPPAPQHHHTHTPSGSGSGPGACTALPGAMTPVVLRRCDLGAVAADAAQSAALAAEHVRQLEAEEQQREEEEEEQRRRQGGEGSLGAATAAAAGMEGTKAVAQTLSLPLPYAAASIGGGGGTGGTTNTADAGAGGGGSLRAGQSLPSPRGAGFRPWSSASNGRSGHDSGGGGGGLAVVAGDVVAAEAASASVADAAAEAAAAAAGAVTAMASTPPSSLYDLFFGSAGFARRSSGARGGSTGGGTPTAATAASAAAAAALTLTSAVTSPTTTTAAPDTAASAHTVATATASPAAAPPPSSFSLPVRSPSLSAGGCPPALAPPSSVAPPPSGTGPLYNRAASTGGGGGGAVSGACGAVGGIAAAAASAPAQRKASAGGGGGGSNPVVRPATLLAALLQDLRERCGLLHLGLVPVEGPAEAGEGRGGGGGGGGREGSTTGCGLVAIWRREVVAVVEPGPEADRLLASLTGAASATPGPTPSGSPHSGPASTLSALFAAARGGPLECPRSRCCYSLLARQEVWHAGAPLATLLVQVCRPASLLRPADLAALSPQLGGMVVTSATPLPYDVTSALLRAGAAAVVCPDAPLTSRGPAPAASELQSEPSLSLAPAAVTAAPPPPRRGLVARESISFGGCVPLPYMPSAGAGAGAAEEAGMQGALQQPFADLGVGRMSLGAVGGEAGPRMEAEVEVDVGSVVGFYEVLVSELVAGGSVRGALDAAERLHPSLKGRVAFHHL